MSDEREPNDTSVTPETGSMVTVGEGLILRVKGPTTDGIRTSDSRGWDAAADIRDGMVEMASARGIKSEGEDLTLETTQILVRRLNGDGRTLGDPKRLHPNDGDDCEAPDTRGRRYPSQRFSVTRPRMPEGFWEGITAGSNVPPGPALEVARALWDAIEGKRPPTRRTSSWRSTRSELRCSSRPQSWKPSGDTTVRTRDRWDFGRYGSSARSRLSRSGSTSTATPER
jgi:hypothetical protein